jgi:hypothetical protein
MPSRFDPLGAPSSVAPRRIVRLPAAAADRLLAAAPGVVLPATAAVARLASRLGLYGVRPDLVASVVAGLDRRAARRVAQAAAASTAVTGRLNWAIRGGHREIAGRLLDPNGLAAFQRDIASLSRAILVSFHLGPFSAIRAALAQTGARCLYLTLGRGGPAAPAAGAAPEARTAVHLAGRDSDQMAAALWQARKPVKTPSSAAAPPSSCVRLRAN